ncbi:hypothetical protein Ade02nite_71830 [Paractinoplanes deccanensis]|uniref:Uncharacterized protein n=1 Tax=Paractinoplanes deccanensis TaxID=113561 RepID=A0ABQ3YEX7_9ACTN|nr:hypothetical protein [Actinoplanes deccanensis]GID78542.1 hypothetical protein Ade02nite_71830 [Actinoplanes deccanensis]
MTTLARTRSQDRNLGWTLAVAQLLYAAWFAWCAYVTLAHAADITGHWYLPSRDDAYTANADIWADWPWATWIMLTAPMAPVVMALSLIVSAVMFVVSYPRGHRALTMTLIAGAVAALLTLVVSLTPPVQQIIGWVSD